MKPVAAFGRHRGPSRGNDKGVRREFLQYFAASLVALALDLGIFSVTLRLLGMPWFIAATLGFCAGVMTVYWLSVRWVFSARRLRHVPGSEFTLFAAIGVFGLGVTQGVLWIGIEALHQQAELAKLAAAGATFLFNFALRRSLLFVRSSGARA